MMMMMKTMINTTTSKYIILYESFSFLFVLFFTLAKYNFKYFNSKKNKTLFSSSWPLVWVLSCCFFFFLRRKKNFKIKEKTNIIILQCKLPNSPILNYIIKKRWKKREKNTAISIYHIPFIFIYFFSPSKNELKQNKKEIKTSLIPIYYSKILLDF